MGVPEAATFVFTDLVGSTALSAALDRDEAEQLRHAHFGVLRATATANEVFELTTRMGITFAQTIYGAALLRIYLEQGRLGEIVDLARQTAAENPTLPGWRLAIMFMCCQVGRSSEAAALFDHEMSTGLSELPFDVTWLQSMSYLADCAADLGRPDAAPLLYARFAPYADRFIYMGLIDQGAAARPIGRLATMLERYDEAEAHLRHALEIHERMRAPYWIARTQLDLAELMVTRRIGTDLETARTLAAAAQVAVDQRGYAGLTPYARSLLGKI